MLEQTEQQLIDWARESAGIDDVALSLTRRARGGRGVSFHLLNIRPRPLGRGGADMPDLRATLEYLVTTWAPTVREANDLLAQIFVEAMRHPRYHLVEPPDPLAVWTALRLKHRPSFQLEVQLTVPWPKTVAPLVTASPSVAGEAVGRLLGRVVGPGEIAVPGAIVRVPSISKSTRTDGRGLFAIEAVPLAGPLELDVRARGHRRSLIINEQDRADETLLVELDFDHMAQET